MNAVDATDRSEKQDEGEAPSLLTIILDTNPHAWNLIADTLPLSKAVANLLVFINAHLAINHANRVAVLASHSERAEWLYPTPARTQSEGGTTNGTNYHREDTGMQDNGDSMGAGGPVQPQDDANKYRPFAHIEHAILTNLRRLMSITTPESLNSTPATMIAGALTLALSYISKQSQAQPAATTTAQFNYSDPTSVAGGNELNNANTSKSHGSVGLQSRILILSVSGDLATQYIPIMNAIFACQRLDIPLDILKLAGDTVFLQQAADASGGVYMALDANTRAGLLQYLMFAYLPDEGAREHLIVPGEGEGVDFRAACFCHRRIVDIGHLKLSGYGQKPAVVPKKKKKKNRPLEGGGMETPGSEGGTPAPV